MKEIKVVTLKDALLTLAAVCGVTYFFTKKKFKRDYQKELDDAYRRGYNECLDNMKKKEETA